MQFLAKFRFVRKHPPNKMLKSLCIYSYGHGGQGGF